MNERIKELQSQCWEARQYGPPWFDYKKFAVLIAADCVNMIESEAETADEDDVHGMRNAAGLISRAFITFRS